MTILGLFTGRIVRNLVIDFALGLLLASFAGCESRVTEEDIQSQEKVIQEERETLEAMKLRQEVEGGMDQQMTEIRRKIDELKRRADDATGDAEVELRREIAELQTLYDQAERQLLELKAASGDVWARLRIDSEKAWNDLSGSIDKTLDKWKDEADEHRTDPKKDEDQATDKTDDDKPPPTDDDGNG